MAAGAQDSYSQTYQFSIVDFPGAASTSANGVNNLGHIVGSYFDGVKSHGFLYDGTDYITIDYTSLSGNTSLQDINDSGKIVGHFNQTIDNTYYTNDFIYDGQSFTSLSFPGNTETSISGINDTGYAAGGFYDWADNSSKGFLYKDGLSIFPSTVIFTDANDNGLMVGIEPDAYYSVVYDGVQVDYINFQPDNPFGIDIWANGINDAGLIVGYFYDYELNASAGFIYDYISGGVTSLLYPGSLYTSLDGINDLGQLAGSFADENNVTHGFLATPVQATVAEPSLFVLLGMGIAGVGACRFFMQGRH